jgi:signal transduction histidine kinase
MTEDRATRLRAMANKTCRNPHTWVLVGMLAVLLFVYQAWPWQWAQLSQGFWSHFPWFSRLGWLAVHVEIPAGVFGILFFIPIIYGSLTMSWPGGLFAWLVSLTWILPELSTWSVRREPTNLLILFVPVLLAAVIFGERRWREGEKRNYAEREKDRQTYIARLVDSQEGERRRIALEIHDETLQTLLAIANKLDSLASVPAGTDRTEEILWAKEELTRSMDDLRRLSMNLRPSILDNFGVVAGVRWLVDNTPQDTCRITTHVKGEVHKMSSLAEVTVFRVVQQSLSNIQQHAHAQNAKVTMGFEEGSLTLEIIDDGVGFQRAERSSEYVERNKLGIIGMEQRILSLGGEMKLHSSPGMGTRLLATIPYFDSAEFVQIEDARLERDEDRLRA